MKPFNLDSALRGEPICNRKGEPFMFICYLPHADFKREVLVISPAKGSTPESRKRDGRFFNDAGLRFEDDLFMATEPTEMLTDEVVGLGQWRSAVIFPNKAPPPAVADAQKKEEYVAVPVNADQAALMCLLGEQWLREHAPERLKTPPAAAEAPAVPLQERVRPWLMACFGSEIAADRIERNHRFLEESLELVQACGCTRSEAMQLVDYVFDRPVGEPHQEVGGVMITLAALCLANGLDMHEAGETELARIWTKVEQIRAKQAAKPRHSPLPQHVATPADSAANAGLRSVYETLEKIAAFLNIDLEAAKKAPGKPSDVYIAAIKACAANAGAVPSEPEGVQCLRCGFVTYIQDGESPGQTTHRVQMQRTEKHALATKADSSESRAEYDDAPKCRDCADFGPICPSSGKPCGGSND